MVAVDVRAFGTSPSPPSFLVNPLVVGALAAASVGLVLWQTGHVVAAVFAAWVATFGGCLGWIQDGRARRATVDAPGAEFAEGVGSQDRTPRRPPGPKPRSRPIAVQAAAKPAKIRLADFDKRLAAAERRWQKEREKIERDREEFFAREEASDAFERDESPDRREDGDDEGAERPPPPRAVSGKKRSARWWRTLPGHAEAGAITGVALAVGMELLDSSAVEASIVALGPLNATLEIAWNVFGIGAFGAIVGACIFVYRTYRPRG